MFEEQHIVRTSGVAVLLVGNGSALDGETFWSKETPPQVRSNQIHAFRRDHLALSIPVLMDGTFLLLFRAYSVPVDLALISVSDKYDTKLCELLVPPNGLVLRSFDRVELSMPLLAGIYDVRIDWSVDWEVLHYEPLEPDTYPVGDGPDGIITLAPRP